MFGYFRPNDAHLIGDQIGLFNAYYCRLCYCLRIKGGQKARVFTTFDVALYSMIINLFLKQSTPPVVKCEKIKKENMSLFAQDEIGLRIASLSFIAFGEKIRDDELDGNRIRAKFLKLIYGKDIENAKKSEPEIAEISFLGTELINKLQKEHAPLDEVLKAYGDMTIASFSLIAPITDDYKNLISSIAEWTFFIDMVADYDDDVKEGATNSLYDSRYKSLKDYFDNNWYYLYQKNKEISDRVYNGLIAVKDDSIEWITLFKIVVHALDTVMQNILDGKDIKFHYFRELEKNIKINKKRKQANKARGVE